MTEQKTENIKNLQLRAGMPRVFRYVAIGLLVLTVLAVLLGFYRASKNPEFRMQGFPTSLSKDVVASINGYERREMDGDIAKYYIKADKAVSFADNHQEMENVYLQVFDETGTLSDQIRAQKAVYVPAENKNFTAYFSGAVSIATRDSLSVKTEQLTYTKETEIATAEESIQFERKNVKGKAFGATVNVKSKKLELLRDVEIETFDSPELASSGTSSSKLNAGNAVYDQSSEKIELHNSVRATMASKNRSSGQPQTAEVKAGSAIAYLEPSRGENRTFKKIELFDNVLIDSRQSNGKPTKINAGYALYEKDADRFELKNGLHIITVEDDNPTDIKAANGVYEQSSGKINLEGGAEITQGGNFVRGDSIFAELFQNKKIKQSRVLGNALVRQITPEKTTEVNGAEVNAKFNEEQKLLTADVTGTGSAVVTPSKPGEYSKMTMTAQKSINVLFKNDGLLNRIITDGRTTVKLDVPDGAEDASNKLLTADSVKTLFNDSGQDLRTAEAVGNAELVVAPLRASEKNYKTTINAPRFDCEFFPTGNNAKTCVASLKTKTVRVPTQPAVDRGNQTITADKLNANFSPQTKDIERLDAVGKAKFVELDRNAISETISYTTADETVRLRVGEPTVWDSKARAKAPEIDWDTRNQTSVLRGGASTTYYSQENTGGATPFGKSAKPVYVTAQLGEFDHKTETAIYTGNARGWQENNYVRGDKLTIFQKQGRLNVEGNVQSLLYDVKRKENGKETTTPVYASSRNLTYTRDDRLLRYENDVDIRQGKDRITSGLAKIYLTESNELSRTEMENSVVITQPNRKAVGDYAQYTASDEIVILKGNPARVEDAENGTSQGSQMTVYLRENRVVGEGGSKQNATGRTRSVYKIKSN
ncbi:MAG: LPS export ABC transporter periplasmic protein LptC [Pyrinomonadaceae bacterium]